MRDNDQNSSSVDGRILLDCSSSATVLEGELDPATVVYARGRGPLERGNLTIK